MSTPLASESTVPSIGENHPAALAFHALNNAVQIAMAIELSENAQASRMDASDIRRLLGVGLEQLGALYELFQRQERTIEEQRLECLREKRYATRVEEKNSELAQGIINLTREVDQAHAVIVELRADASPHEAPRKAAAGASR